jgi:hypothetical protein
MIAARVFFDEAQSFVSVLLGTAIALTGIAHLTGGFWNGPGAGILASRWGSSRCSWALSCSFPPLGTGANLCGWRLLGLGSEAWSWSDMVSGSVADGLLPDRHTGKIAHRDQGQD